jgi:hypothetical protein
VSVVVACSFTSWATRREHERASADLVEMNLFAGHFSISQFRICCVVLCGILLHDLRHWWMIYGGSIYGTVGVDANLERKYDGHAVVCEG